MVLITHATLEKAMNSVRSKTTVNYCFNDLDSADQLAFQKMSDTNLS